MDRRTLLTGLAFIPAAGLILPAWAQTQTGQQTQGTTQGTTQGAARAGSTAGMSEPARMARHGMLMSLMASEMALQRAQDQRVREFAQLEATEQRTLLAVTGGHAMRPGAAAQAGQTQAGQTQAGQTQAGQTQAGQTQAGQTQAGQAGADQMMANDPMLQQEMQRLQGDQMAQQEMQRLQQAQGRDFDRAYIEAQMQGHEKLRQAMQQVASQGQDPVQHAVALVALPAIDSHMAMLRHIQQQMGG